MPAAASLMRAIEMLRARRGRLEKPALPQSAPTGFCPATGRPMSCPAAPSTGAITRLCVLSELRDRLRAGDVWVAGSRQYRSFEERLISPTTRRSCSGRHSAGRRGGVTSSSSSPPAEALLDRAADRDQMLAPRDGRLPDVTITNGDARRSRPSRNQHRRRPEALAARALLLLPRIRSHRPPIRSGDLDAVPRLLHPSSHRRPFAADSRVLDGGTARRWPTISASTHMAEACRLHRQPQPARLDG